MKPLDSLRRLALALGLASTAATAAPLDDMVAFDAVYIPALAQTSAAGSDAKAAPKAQAAMQRLVQQWPQHKDRLAAAGRDAGAAAAWNKGLAAVERDIRSAATATGAGRFGDAHEALEPVRITLMQLRQQQGMDYFVDSLTAYHEPMEELALAGSQLKPDQVDAARVEQLTRAYTKARALWRGIESERIDAQAYALSPQREAQLVQAIRDESAALDRLSDTLRGNDTAALLKAAAAIKPPFARAYVAFGQAEPTSSR
jgi:hypothetical protein